jgi:hypothetical protein
MQRKPSKKNPMVKTLRNFSLLGISIALTYLLFAPDSNKRSFHPVTIADLKGVWTTTAPQYRDRFLQFSEETVTFGRGKAGAGTYIVQGIDSERAEKSTLVHIYYNDLAATDFQLNFDYVDQGGGMIKMNNQKGIFWFRTSTEPIYDPTFK